MRILEIGHLSFSNALHFLDQVVLRGHDLTYEAFCVRLDGKLRYSVLELLAEPYVQQNTFQKLSLLRAVNVVEVAVHHQIDCLWVLRRAHERTNYVKQKHLRLHGNVDLQSFACTVVLQKGVQ